MSQLVHRILFHQQYVSLRVGATAGVGGYHSKVGRSFPVQKGLHLLPMHLRCYVSGTQDTGFRLLEAVFGLSHGFWVGYRHSGRLT